MAFTSEFWTPERETQLVELAAQKRYTSAELSQLLGCTRSMVVGKCSREKIPLLNWSEASIVTRENRRAQLAAAKLVREQRAAEKRQALMAASAVDPLSLNIAPENLRDNQCHFPYGDGSGIRFCGQPREAAGWYCSHHRARCHIIPTKRAR